MELRAKEFWKLARVSLAGIMAVWLSGVVLLFCCHPVVASPAAYSCPMAKMSAHCDKAKKHTADSHVVTRPTADCIECGFLPVVFDKSRKVDQVQKQAAPTAERIAVRFDPLVFVDVKPEPVASYRWAPSFDRVFIRNCVFRI